MHFTYAFIHPLNIFYHRFYFVELYALKCKMNCIKIVHFRGIFLVILTVCCRPHRFLNSSLNATPCFIYILIHSKTRFSLSEHDHIVISGVKFRGQFRRHFVPCRVLITQQNSADRDLKIGMMLPKYFSHVHSSAHLMVFIFLLCSWRYECFRYESIVI